MKYEAHFEEVEKCLTENIFKALTDIGNLVKAESKLRCPVETGILRRSVGYRTNKEDAYVVVGTNVDYSPYVHNGTSRQKAQPFLKDAIMQNINEINSIIKDNLSKVGDK
ncbi:HK97-gp10 family putative phage morphogenesis protein [Clostridium niameyense]|uniref:HK97-gp10 family putative phage morphogenesis protein n=1 Tax=Clostridium niameyense TaxID=1622073 RepID=UPI00067EC2F6|nr:HK97-gp10 family putative phage morphogenesis protein [Clostridium niameyense]